MERATGGIVFVWGENERLKAFNFDFATKRIASFRAQGTQMASGNMDAPGGMPGGRLVVSSNGTAPGTGVVWGVYPTQGNANSAVVPGALVAYHATTVLNGGKLKQLFHSDANPANKMGNFAKYSTPVVANGRVYVGTFSNKVVQYGLVAAQPCGRCRTDCAHPPGTPCSCWCRRTCEQWLERFGWHDVRVSEGCPECSSTRGSQSPFAGNVSVCLLQNHQRLSPCVL